jgi:hypothetical protein
LLNKKRERLKVKSSKRKIDVCEFLKSKCTLGLTMRFV